MMSQSSYADIYSWSEERRARAQRLYKAKSTQPEDIVEALHTEGLRQIRERLDAVSARYPFPKRATLWLFSMVPVLPTLTTLALYLKMPVLALAAVGYGILTLYKANQTVTDSLAQHRAALSAVSTEDLLQELLEATEEHQ